MVLAFLLYKITKFTFALAFEGHTLDGFIYFIFHELAFDFQGQFC